MRKACCSVAVLLAKWYGTGRQGERVEVPVENRRGIAQRRETGSALPAAVGRTSCQPNSTGRPRMFFAPAPRATIWAPRQTPSTALSASPKVRVSFARCGRYGYSASSTALCSPPQHDDGVVAGIGGGNRVALPGLAKIDLGAGLTQGRTDLAERRADEIFKRRGRAFGRCGSTARFGGRDRPMLTARQRRRDGLRPLRDRRHPRHGRQARRGTRCHRHRTLRRGRSRTIAS